MKGIFIGIAGGTAKRCLEMIKTAVQRAQQPGRLAFGLCPGEMADPAPFFQAAGSASLQIMSGDSLTPAAALMTVYGLYDGQEYALQITPDAVLHQDWDRCLLESLDRTGSDKSVLTCFLSPEGIPRALAVQGFTADDELQIAPGMKVLKAVRPPRTVLVSPAFLFGRGDWMCKAKNLRWDGSTVLSLTLQLFALGYATYVPHLPISGCVLAVPLPPERFPAGGMTALLPEFGQASGIFFDKNKADAEARLGIYTDSGRYPVQLSMADGLKQLFLRRREAPVSRVMLATAMGSFQTELPQEVSLTLFQNMTELKRLSLCCYCLSKQAKRLQQIFPNTYARPEGEKDTPSFTDASAFLRSKPYFIQEAAHQFQAHSHYGWIDMDYLKHPIHESSVFLWDALTDEKIHLAMVDGQIDTGLLIVPRSKVAWLYETSRVLAPDPEMSHGDGGLFKCLADTYPDAFTIHTMDKRHMLLSLCQPLISGGLLYDA